MMPKSQQASSPPPAYINHADVAATHIGILQIDSERNSTAPTKNPNTESEEFLSKLEHAVRRLKSSREDRLISRLETVLSRQAEANTNSSCVKKDMRKPIRLKDAVGRRLSFPYHRCETWTGSKIPAVCSFLNVVTVGQRVNEGHYDIFNPAGDVILPQVWEDYVQPGWEISMSIRPALGHRGPWYPPPPPMPPSNGPPNAPVHFTVHRLLGPPNPPPVCFRPHYSPGYSSGAIVPEKGIRRLWQKVKGIFTKKQTNYDSKSIRSLLDD
ncbi:bb4ea793-acb5-4a07-9cff-ad8fb9cd905b [Sclerotinia trifoliorum]|uniref:Bb4ea793-acb5-4a07-9cff-ad8fb9cd905b n=1 Tax=Sclerotinia trifoliorum TaxID=28548 RepID=A0A8H2VYY7_9HELO|nr:bb4ea793-acb5-4a07-9cff-ad8fb9cd905b [Sclerotinia trifoliorum]